MNTRIQLRQRNIAPYIPQSKLNIFHSDDTHKQIAECVVDRGTHIPNAAIQCAPMSIQRCSTCATAMRIEDMCPTCAAKATEESHQLQRSATGIVPEVTPEIESGINALRGGGQPLDTTRTFMEPRFGHDFSQVRVHIDERAAQTAQSINALAYTVGQDVVFSAGQYQPGTSAGQRLLAHELTHVVQQGSLVSSTRSIQAASVIQRVEGPCEDLPARLPHQLLTRGTVHPDVREAQGKLNQYHQQEQAAGRPGLPDAPLIKDCIFGSKTFNATLAFQQQRFPGQLHEHDGKIGNHTWDELDKVGTAILPPISVTPTPQHATLPEPTVPSVPTTPPASSPTGTLPSTIKFWINAFIPNTYSGAFPAPAGTFAGRQVFKGPFHPFHRNSCFETDDRGFTSRLSVSSRLHIESEFDTRSKALSSVPLSAGPTFEIDCTSGATKCSTTSKPRGVIALVPPVIPGSQLFDILINTTNNDPCILGSPDIAIRGRIGINLSARTFQYLLFTTLFPAIEMYISIGGGVPSTLFTQSPLASSVFLLVPPGVVPHANTVAF